MIHPAFHIDLSQRPNKQGLGGIRNTTFQTRHALEFEQKHNLLEMRSPRHRRNEIGARSPSRKSGNIDPIDDALAAPFRERTFRNAVSGAK
jgi:hypothetical protein